MDWEDIQLKPRAFVLLDTETADWAELSSPGSAFEMNGDKRTPDREWTRLVQYNYMGQGPVILDLSTQEGVAGLEDLRRFVDTGVEFVIHNMMYDLPRLAKLGIYPQHLFDTMIASQMCFTGCPEIRHNLADVMLREVGVDPYAAIELPRILAEAERKLKDLDHWNDWVERRDYAAAKCEEDSDDISAADAMALWREQNPPPFPTEPMSKESIDKWVLTQANMSKKRLQNSDWGKLELTDAQLRYAAADVGEEYLAVYKRLKERIVERGVEKTFQLEMQFIPIIAQMSVDGMKFNLYKWKELIAEKTATYEALSNALVLQMDTWFQQFFPERYMITLRRKKPKPGTPAKWSKPKPAKYNRKGELVSPEVPAVLITPEIPAQELGDLARVQAMPELSPLAPIQDTLLRLEKDDYRIGAPIRKELGLTPGDTVAITKPALMRELVNVMLDTTGDGFDQDEVVELIELAEKRQNQELAKFLKDFQEAALLRKLVSTYGESYWKYCDRGGYIHASFSTVETDTHRVQAREPNELNMPRDLQKALWCCEEDEVMIKGDYSAQEARLIFYVGKQLDIYHKLVAGMDFHSLSASIMTGTPYTDIVTQTPGKKDKVKPEFDELRTAAKPVSFAPMFGAGAGKIAQLLEVDWKKGNKFVDDYWRMYPMVKVMQDRQIAKTIQHGYVTDLTYGRKRFFSPTAEDRRRIEAGEDPLEVLYRFRNPAMNYSAQCNGATILRVAMLKLSNWIKRNPETGAVIRLTVHDAIITTCKAPYAARVAAAQKHLMEQAAQEVVPGIYIGVDIDILNKTAPRFFEEEYVKTA